jgi:hypothetical protein
MSLNINWTWWEIPAGVTLNSNTASINLAFVFVYYLITQNASINTSRSANPLQPINIPPVYVTEHMRRDS